MPLTYWGIIIGAVSLIGAVGIPVLMYRSNKTLTHKQIDDYDRQRKEAEDKKDRKRKEEDERREGQLREQLDALGEMNQQRFKQWQETTEALDDLWSFVEDELLPYTRTAYARIRGEDPSFPRPPQLRHRPRPRPQSQAVVGDG